MNLDKQTGEDFIAALPNLIQNGDVIVTNIKYMMIFTDREGPNHLPKPTHPEIILNFEISKQYNVNFDERIITIAPVTKTYKLVKTGEMVNEKYIAVELVGTYIKEQTRLDEPSDGDYSGINSLLSEVENILGQSIYEFTFGHISFLD